MEEPVSGLTTGLVGAGALALTLTITPSKKGIGILKRRVDTKVDFPTQ